LKSIGIQVRVSQTLTIPSQCKTLLIYTSYDVTYSPSVVDVLTLTTFVMGGGKLIFMSQVPTALRTLAGVSAATVNTVGSRSIMQLTNKETTLQALKGFDFTDYFDISMPFYENYTNMGLNNVGYTPVSSAQTLAKYLVRSNVNNAWVDSADTSATNAAIVKYQPLLATGYVYSFGVDLGYLYIQAQNENGGYSPYYDGHYYPGYDIGTRIIKNILSSNDHFVSLWPVPNNMGLAFTTTWDIDTYVSYPHGQGIAAAAQDRGAGGNLNLHVKYISDTYESAYFQYGVPYIYQITGFRTAPDGYPYIDFGSHTVSHSPNAVQFPYGTLSEQYVLGSTAGYSPAIHQCGTGASDGTPDNGETCAKGGTSGLSFWTSGASASGEIRVSAFLIRYLLNTVFKTNYNLTTYRPGNLAWNKYQSSLAVANGFIGGSSCAANAHLSHLPFQVGHNREAYQELNYFEFPLQWSDGDGNMSSANFPGSDFANQVAGIKKMARYGGHYNILIHPSDALFDKIQIQRALHDAVRPFAVYFNQTGIANWWTNRDRAFVDITASSILSVTMTVRLDGPTEGLTLNVPKTYTYKSMTGGSLTVCQQPSYDTFTNAIVLKNTAKGTYTLTFSVGSSASTVSTCSDFTVQPATDCIAWDVAIDDFLETYYYNKGINLLLLTTTATGLTSNAVNGTLQLSANSNSGVNNYYTEISRFCFDASVYTHMFFDMVAPVGSSFYVQLVSYDSGCNTAQPSTTFLDVSSYAAFDGKNHTVQIRLSDFVGQDLLHVRGIQIVNISPAETPIYIDNLKLQKRCSTAPGDDFTNGLAIESFQNVDRWVTGINNLFGKTDYDNSMTSVKLSELGSMQLVPSNAQSYFYSSTTVNGVKLNATGYTSVSLNVRGPAGGSFDVVVTSGSGNTNSTVNTATYATLSASKFMNITIPVTAFTGLTADSVSMITLKNFTPNGGTAATNTFTLRWISLLGGSNSTALSSRCQSATGYVVLDFCNPLEFKSQANALGGPMSDDNTMLYYNQTASGYINLVANDTTSRFYSIFNSTGCAVLDSTNTGVILTVSGPQGATADIGFTHGTTGCRTSPRNDFISISFNTAPTQLTIPFSRFPSGFNAQYLQAFIMTNFNKPGAVYHIHSLVFVGANSVPGCGLCTDTIVDTCTFIPTIPRNNLLGGSVTDEGSLSSYSVASDGGLSFGTKSDSYWYSIFGSGCYNATNATGIHISVAAPANTTFQVSLRWMSDAACTTAAPASSVAITSYVTFIGNASSSQYQLAQIPFTAFSGIDVSRLNNIAISGFTPSGVALRIGCVSLAVFTPPSDGSAACASCPATSWLNYCSSGSANKNSMGGIQSDDGTMRATTSVANRALVLQPAATGSYWYSVMNCLDISLYATLYINVTATAGSSFNVKLQSSSNACADTTQLQSASLSSTNYGNMTGSAVLLAIPLASYTTLNSAIKLSSIYTVVFESFSSGSATYSFNCAYYGIGAAVNGTVFSANSSTSALLNGTASSSNTTSSFSLSSGLSTSASTQGASSGSTGTSGVATLTATTINTGSATTSAVPSSAGGATSAAGAATTTTTTTAAANVVRRFPRAFYRPDDVVAEQSVAVDQSAEQSEGCHVPEYLAD
jgi:hypothetical protein